MQVLELFEIQDENRVSNSVSMTPALRNHPLLCNFIDLVLRTD